MKTVYLLLIFLTITLSSLHAQSPEVSITDMPTASAGISGAWLSYEKGIRPTISIIPHIGMIGFFDLATDNEGQRTFNPNATAGLELRNYYNLRRRTTKGKNTALNSANFFAIHVEHRWRLSPTPQDFMGNALVILPYWGIRRSLSSRMYLEGTLGLAAYRETDRESEFTFEFIAISPRLKLGLRL